MFWQMWFTARPIRARMAASAPTHLVDSSVAVRPGTQEQTVRQVRYSSRWVGGKNYSIKFKSILCKHHISLQSNFMGAHM